MEKNNIILKAKMYLVDKQAREMLSRLETKINTINERTKIHTLELRRLKK